MSLPQPAPAVDPSPDHWSPVPLAWHVARLNGQTAIARVWEPSDPALCQLCPKGRCVADQIGDTAVCLILTEEPVTDRGARLFKIGPRPEPPRPRGIWRWLRKAIRGS